MKHDLLGNPDYELYFADNIFLMDHEKNEGYIIVNCDGDKRQQRRGNYTRHRNVSIIISISHGSIRRRRKIYKAPCRQHRPIPTRTNMKKWSQTAKKHIIDGDIFQVVLSRTIIEPCPDEPLDVYKRLRELNPSPYMFYINTPNTILTGLKPGI